MHFFASRYLCTTSILTKALVTDSTFLSTKIHLPDANWLLETRLTSDSSSSTFPSWSPSIDFSTSFVDFIRFKVDSTQGLVHGYNELRWSMKDDRLSWTEFQSDALLILQSDDPRLMNQWETEKKSLSGGGPIMLAILVVVGTKYACNLEHDGDQICLQS